VPKLNKIILLCIFVNHVKVLKTHTCLLKHCFSSVRLIKIVLVLFQITACMSVGAARLSRKVSEQDDLL